MNLYKINAIIFVIFLFAYFIELFWLIYLIKNRNSAVWKNIGSPDLFSPAGQLKLFSLIFGFNEREFKLLTENVRRKCLRIRFYMAAGIISFLVLMFVIATTG